jgi:hypothetical protein
MKTKKTRTLRKGRALEKIKPRKPLSSYLAQALQSSNNSSGGLFGFRLNEFEQPTQPIARTRLTGETLH